MISNLPAEFAGKNLDRLLIKPRPKYSGHFLSIIAFDGNVTMHTTESAMLAQSRKKLWQGWKFHAGEGQGRSRNECAHRFLHDTQCEYHDLIDSDIKFTAEHVEALRRHPEAKEAIIGGAYPKKQEKIEFCLNPLPGAPTEPNPRGLLEVAKVGTGFMQIPRVVYERMRAAYPAMAYKCDYDVSPSGVRADKHAFFCEQVRFDEDVGFNRHLTEDWMFCYLARKIGIKIYVDLSTTAQPWIEHRGPILYPLPVEIERGRIQAELDIANQRIAELEKQLPPSASSPRR